MGSSNKSLTFDIFGRDKSGSQAIKQVANASDDLTARAVAGGKAMLAQTGAVVAGYVGLKATIGAGFDRLADIEDAGASLKGLGDSQAQILSIQGSALSAVLDTSYRLNDAMTIAATASAAGVKQGADLTRYLSIVADTAAETRSSLLDVGDTLNGVVTIGAAYNDSLQILAQKGLPIYSLLADQLHVTTADIKNMASQGQISSDMLLDAIQNKIGGAAKSLGDTTRGSLANVGASFARTGANLISGVFPSFKTFFQGTTDLMKPLESASKEIGKDIGGMVAFWASVPAPVMASVVAMGAMIALRGPLSGMLTAGGKGLQTVVAAFSLIPDVARGAQAEARAAGKEISMARGYLNGFTGAARTAGSTLVSSFGGAAGLGVALGIVAITAAVTSWTQATIEQQQAEEALLATLDKSTGKVTDDTTQSITDTLSKRTKHNDGFLGIGAGDVAVKSTLDLLDELGVKTDNISAKVAGTASGYGAVKKQIEGIIAKEVEYSNTHTDAAGNTTELSDRYYNAEKALSALEKQHKATAKATQQWTQQEIANGDAITEAVDSTTYALEDLDKKIKGVFSKADAAADVSDSFDSLASSIVGSSKVIDSATSDGAANATKLESAISSLAVKANGDSAKFQGSVIGLINGLKSQGVDVTKIMGVVEQSVEAVTGRKWSVLLDGSQSIAEAKKIAKAALAAAEALLGAEMATTNGEYLGTKDQDAARKKAQAIRANLADLKAAASEANSVSSSFNSSYGAAVAAAAAKDKTSTSTADAKATAAQRKRTKELKAAINDMAFTAADGSAMSVAAIRKMAAKWNDAISTAYDDKKITKKEKTSLSKTVDEWMKDAKSARKDVNEITSGIADWFNPSEVDSATKDMLDKIDAALKNKSITKTVHDALTKQVTDVGTAGTSAEAWAKAWGVNGMIDGVQTSARDIIAAAADAQAGIEWKFAQGLITKDARDSAIDSITTTTDDLRQAAADAKKAIGDVAESWTNAEDLDDDARKRLGMLSTGAQELKDSILDAFNAGGIDAGQRDTLLAYVETENRAMFALADERQSAVDALAAAQSSLDTQVSDKASWRQSIEDGIVQLGSVTDALSSKTAQITRTWTEMRDGKTVTFQDAIDGSMGSVEDIKQNLTDRIAATQQFQKNLSILRAEGLDDTSYKQIVDDFVSKGTSASADALLAGGAEAVKQVAGLQGDLAAAASGLANQVADDYYDVGIRISEGIVKGLQDHLDDLNALGQLMGDTIVGSIKTSLGIASPSKRARATTRFVGAGAVLGLLDGVSDVSAAAARLGDAATPYPSAEAMLRAADANSMSVPSGSSISQAMQATGGVVNVEVISKGDLSLDELIELKINGQSVSVAQSATVSLW